MGNENNNSKNEKTATKKNEATELLEAAAIMQRNGILHGISWHKYCTIGVNPNDDGAELHIGNLKNFRIHLSTTRVPTEYFMQLREMVVIPEADPETGITVAVPQYMIQIPNTHIVADDLDAAKCAAVQKVLDYIMVEYKVANERYDNMMNLFGDLNKILSEKVAASRSAETIDKLDISAFTKKALANAGITLIGELTSKTREELKAAGIGTTSINNVMYALHKANMRLLNETTSGVTAHDIAMNNAAKNAAEKAAAKAAEQEDPASGDTSDENNTVTNTGTSAPAPGDENTDTNTTSACDE